MTEQHNNSDKITFKVKHLGEYHEIVIDLSDDRYEYKHQQIFEQLETITGIPNKYASLLSLARAHLNDEIYPLRDVYVFGNEIIFGSASMIDLCGRSNDDLKAIGIRDGERFHLRYQVTFEDRNKHINMNYYLVAETGHPEGICSWHICRSQCTEAWFKRLKDIVNNDELNSTITQLMEIASSMPNRILEEKKIMMKYNIEQIFYCSCEFNRRRRANMNMFRGRSCPLYLRTRG